MVKISLYTILHSNELVVRGYKPENIRQKLIELLGNSEDGMSGIEISEKLAINRITMTKYLKVFAAEGFLRQKNIGNLTLWFLEPGQESYEFPSDYFKVATEYLDILLKRNESQALSLIKNCVHSGASPSRLVVEVMLPAVNVIQKMYDDGKIGASEKKLLQNTVSRSFHMFTQIQTEPDPKKNIVVIAADPESILFSEAASASFYSDGWRVFHLGDMSSAINILFDLDLQKMMGKIWKQRSGVMVVVVFSNSEEGLNFFADSIMSVKEKLSKKIKIGLCGKTGKKTKIPSDLLSEKFETVLQWAETVYETSK